jgi:cytochrome c oxidase subunit 2
MNRDWQSALAPAGPDAAIIAQFTWVMSAAALLILGALLALLALAVYRGPRPVNTVRWIAGLGIAFPAALLTALLVWSTWRSARLAPQTSGDALVIAVTARMWWWEVRYRDPAGGPDIVAANEIHIPAGRPVYLSLTSSDVIHSMWIPRLAGKIDLVPGRRTGLRVSADRPGLYRGQCAEFCGAQHARMALHVVAQAPADFDRWLAAQRQPARTPADAFVERGRAAFLAQRCGTCHTIRGVQEHGRLGPDLTHVGSRTHIAAGTLRNHRGTLAGWIADPQASKPGAAMPPARDIDGDSLRALAVYLEQLK